MDQLSSAQRPASDNKLVAPEIKPAQDTCLLQSKAVHHAHATLSLKIWQSVCVHQSEQRGILMSTKYVGRVQHWRWQKLRELYSESHRIIEVGKTNNVIWSDHQPMPAMALDHVTQCDICSFLENLQGCSMMMGKLACKAPCGFSWRQFHSDLLSGKYLQKKTWLLVSFHLLWLVEIQIPQ